MTVYPISFIVENLIVEKLVLENDTMPTGYEFKLSN